MCVLHQDEDIALNDDLAVWTARNEKVSCAGLWVNSFVSCLLSMLSDRMGSVPVAAVRRAVEAAWRPLCVHADAETLHELVAVVSRLDMSVSREGDEMFEATEQDADGDEDEEDSDDEDASSDEEEEEENNSEEEKRGQMKVDSLQQGKKGDKKGATETQADSGSIEKGKKRGRESVEDGGGEEEDEESDGGLDDAAMFRIDKYLAQTFSTLKSGIQVCCNLEERICSLKTS